MSEQKPLNLLLDEIEKRVEFAKQFGYIASKNYWTDVSRLIKALREGRRRFLVHMGPETQLETKEYDTAITAILNGEEEKALVERGAE
jgi:hypothetical protein